VARASITTITGQTININGQIGSLNSNLSFTIASGGNVASVTGSGGITNQGGATTGAVVLVLTDATTGSLAKADTALQSFTESDTLATNALNVHNTNTASHANLYPRTNPSNYVDRAGATQGMQVAGAYLTSESDPVALPAITTATQTIGVVYNWGDGKIYNTGGTIPVVDIFAQYLNDDGWYLSVDWSARQLFGALGTNVMMDWGARTLYGNWFLNGGGSATNAGAAGAGLYAMSNGTWTAFTPGSGTGGGGADLASTNYFRNAVNLTNLTAAGIVTNNSDSFTVTNKMTANQLWFGTNAYWYFNTTGVVEVIP
jgi:hypothetical protein